MRDFNRPAKCKQTLTVKKKYFSYEIHPMRSVMLSLSAEIIRKFMSIDISFSIRAFHSYDKMDKITRKLANSSLEI